MARYDYTPDQKREITEANRSAWDQAAPYHWQASGEELEQGFAAPGFNTLPGHNIEKLSEIGIEGKSIAQLCCNNGQELLSLKGMGAESCVGFDASDAFLQQARKLKSISGYDGVEFVTTDIYDVPDQWRGPYDIVMSTIGVISWMPDLDALFGVYSNLTRPGGHVFIEEMHPVLFMYEEDHNGGPSFLKYSYFNQQPFREEVSLDYLGGQDYHSSPHFSFSYTLSDIVMAAIGQGLVLKDFRELDYDISFFCADLEDAEAVPPLGMTMTWYKPERE